MRQTSSGIAPFVWGTLLTVGLGAAIVYTAMSPESSSPTESRAVLVPLDPPTGGFDPVVRMSAVTERFTPPTNIAVSDPTGEDVGTVQSEVDMFVNGDEIVVAWNDSDGFGGPGSITGYGYSTDRGETWTDGGDLPDISGVATWGDPSVVRTNSGQWIIASLDQGSPLGLAIHRAPFAGSLTFPAPISFTDDNDFLDKEFLAYDPDSSLTFMTYLKVSAKEIRFTRSEDDGFTWSAPVTVSPSGNGNGAYPTVGIDGELYVTWVAPVFQPNGELKLRRSPDGGITWPDTVRTVATLGPDSFRSPECFNRGRNITWPTTDVDRSFGPNRGRLYMAWSDGAPDSFDVYFAYSDDKGDSFSSPVILNDNVNVSEQIFPHLRVSDADGRITVAWYDRRNDGGLGAALTDLYMVQSVDGGETWGPNRRISDQSVAWCGVPVDVEPNFGDYVALFVDERSVFTAWGDARNGDPDVFFARKDDRHHWVMTADVDTLDTWGASGTAWLLPNVVTWTTSDSLSREVEGHLAHTVSSIGMSFLATPIEDDGVFDVSGEAMTGALTLTSPDGAINGAISLTRFAADSLSFGITADVDSLLRTLPFDSLWTSSLMLTDGEMPFEVDLTGTVAFPTDTVDYVFDVDGTFTMDNALVSFFRTHAITQTAEYTPTDSTCTLTTRTSVEVTDIVPVLDPPGLGANPIPLVLLKAKPNPWQPSTRIVYDIDRATKGSIRVFDTAGRLVRTISEGRFAAGRHEVPFDGRDDRGRPLGSGGYFVRFDNEVIPVTKKLFVVR